MILVVDCGHVSGFLLCRAEFTSWVNRSTYVHVREGFGQGSLVVSWALSRCLLLKFRHNHKLSLILHRICGYLHITLTNNMMLEHEQKLQGVLTSCSLLILESGWLDMLFSQYIKAGVGNIWKSSCGMRLLRKQLLPSLFLLRLMFYFVCSLYLSFKASLHQRFTMRWNC